MEYSAGMVSQVFALDETRKTAELLSQGMSKDEAWVKIQSENLYQIRNPVRLGRTFDISAIVWISFRKMQLRCCRK